MSDPGRAVALSWSRTGLLLLFIVGIIRSSIGCGARLEVPVSEEGATLRLRAVLSTERSGPTAITWSGMDERNLNNIDTADLPVLPDTFGLLEEFALGRDVPDEVLDTVVADPGAPFLEVTGLDPGVWAMTVSIEQPDGSVPLEIPCDPVAAWAGSAIHWDGEDLAGGGPGGGVPIGNGDFIVIEGDETCRVREDIAENVPDLEVSAVDCTNCTGAGDQAFPGDLLSLRVTVRNLGPRDEVASTYVAFPGPPDSRVTPVPSQPNPDARALDPLTDLVVVGTVDRLRVPTSGEAVAVFDWDTTDLEEASHCIAFGVRQLLGEAPMDQDDCDPADNQPGGNVFAKLINFTVLHDVRIEEICARGRRHYGEISVFYDENTVEVRLQNLGEVDETVDLTVAAASRPYVYYQVPGDYVAENILLPAATTNATGTLIPGEVTVLFSFDPTGFFVAAPPLSIGTFPLTLSLEQVEATDDGDNQISFDLPLFADTDMDSVANPADSCQIRDNLGQEDPDGDGFGTRCDPDFNQDGSVDQADRDILQCVLAEGASDPAALLPLFDLNGDGVVDNRDPGEVGPDATMGVGQLISGRACADATLQTPGAWPGPRIAPPLPACAGLVGVASTDVPCLLPPLPACKTQDVP